MKIFKEKTAKRLGGAKRMIRNQLAAKQFGTAKRLSQLFTISNFTTASDPDPSTTVTICLPFSGLISI